MNSTNESIAARAQVTGAESNDRKGPRVMADQLSSMGVTPQVATRPAKRQGPVVLRALPRVPDWIYTVLIVMLLLLFMEVGVRREWVSRLMVATPTSIFEQLKIGFESGIYFTAMKTTLSSTLIGFALAAVLGNIIAAPMAVIPRFERIMMPLVVALQSMPKIAIAPLILIWVGFGIESQILVVVLVAIFPVLVNSLQGLRLRDREQYELSSSLGASSFQIFRYVRLPGSMPYVFAGLHIAAIFSLLGAIAAEFVGASSGLGVLMLQQRASLNVAGTFAILIILMVFGVLLNAVMTILERKIVFWSKEVANVSA